jgi:hypothetical protein
MKPSQEQPVSSKKPSISSFSLLDQPINHKSYLYNDKTIQKVPAS